jgi:hypothetical protein
MHTVQVLYCKVLKELGPTGPARPCPAEPQLKLSGSIASWRLHSCPCQPNFDIILNGSMKNAHNVFEDANICSDIS